MAASVSVGLASYNGAAHIGEQLASIAAQTRPPDELIVADDRSIDDTPGIVRRYADTVPFPVRLVRHPANIGILENFYAAFAACTGEVIVYCDQDDVWRPDKLARQIAEIERGAMLCMHASEIVDGDLRPMGRTEPANSRHGLIRAPVDVQAIGGFGHQMMFRRPVLDMMVALRAIAERLSSTGLSNSFDRYIPFCASLLGPIAILPEPLVRFRRHGNATSGAGLVAAESPPLRDRVCDKIEATEVETREAIAIAEAGVAGGAIEPATVDALLAALRRKQTLASCQRAILHRHSRFGKLLAALPAVLAATAPFGFGNDDRPRALKFTAAAAVLS